MWFFFQLQKVFYPGNTVMNSLYLVFNSLFTVGSNTLFYTSVMYKLWWLIHKLKTKVRRNNKTTCMSIKSIFITMTYLSHTCRLWQYFRKHVKSLRGKLLTVQSPQKIFKLLNNYEPLFLFSVHFLFSYIFFYFFIFEFMNFSHSFTFYV